MTSGVGLSVLKNLYREVLAVGAAGVLTDHDRVAQEASATF